MEIIMIIIKYARQDATLWLSVLRHDERTGIKQSPQRKPVQSGGLFYTSRSLWAT